MRVFLAIIMSMMFFQGAKALEFPRECRGPTAVIDQIKNINSTTAEMSGHVTLPDIIFACHEGSITQGTMAPAECLQMFIDEGKVGEQVSATANCEDRTVRVNQNPLVKFPIDNPNCADGSFSAIEAFGLLCPKASNELQIEMGKP